MCDNSSINLYTVKVFYPVNTQETTTLRLTVLIQQDKVTVNMTTCKANVYTSFNHIIRVRVIPLELS